MITKEEKKQSRDEMRDVITKAYEGNKFLHLKSYVSNNGSVDTMTIQMLGPNGYKDCLAKSLEMLSEGTVDLNVEDGLEMGAKAAASLSTSWAKSIAGLHKKKNYKEELSFQEIDEIGYTINNAKQCVIRNVVVWIRFNEVIIPKNKSNDPLVRAKNEITYRTPMGGYRGQLNLHPDKVELVTGVRDKDVPDVAIEQWPEKNQRFRLDY